jgi:hypothetical protein
MTLKQTLRALGAVVLEEAERNPDFAQRLLSALGAGDELPGAKTQEKPVPATKRRRTRAAAVVDPMAVLADHGEDALRRELQLLTLDKLLDIVAEFAMDPSKLVMKWKRPERVVDHIVDNAKRRSVKGDAFRA